MKIYILCFSFLFCVSFVSTIAFYSIISYVYFLFVMRSCLADCVIHADIIKYKRGSYDILYLSLFLFQIESRNPLNSNVNWKPDKEIMEILFLLVKSSSTHKTSHIFSLLLLFCFIQTRDTKEPYGIVRNCRIKRKTVCLWAYTKTKAISATIGLRTSQ